MYVCMYACMHACMHVCTLSLTSICMYNIHVHRCIYTYVCVCVCVCVCGHEHLADVAIEAMCFTPRQTDGFEILDQALKACDACAH